MEIRQAGIDLNHWYVVARGCELKRARPLGVRLWQQDIVLYRDASGCVRALADRCPHRQVKLSQGRVCGDRLECFYHGWQFDASGQCVRGPAPSARQHLPACRVQTYPVRERDGFIWLFPGEASRAEGSPLLGLPEWNDPKFVAAVVTLDCQAHFSLAIENLMDMHHEHLHHGLQPWTEAMLAEIRETDDRVDACYSVRCVPHGQLMASALLRSALPVLEPAAHPRQPEQLQTSYAYPHWQLALGQDLRAYGLLCPLGSQQTRVYLVYFLALPALGRAPVWLRRGLQPLLSGIARGWLATLARQDVTAIEREQRAYCQDPYACSHEPNQTVASVQRVVRFQALAAIGAHASTVSLENRGAVMPSVRAYPQARERVVFRSDRASSRSK